MIVFSVRTFAFPRCDQCGTDGAPGVLVPFEHDLRHAVTALNTASRAFVTPSIGLVAPGGEWVCSRCRDTPEVERLP